MHYYFRFICETSVMLFLINMQDFIMQLFLCFYAHFQSQYTP